MAVGKTWDEATMVPRSRPPESPDPPWPPESPDPPWVPERAPPWRPVALPPVPWRPPERPPPSPLDGVWRKDTPSGGGRNVSPVSCFPSSRDHIWLVPVPVLVCSH